MRACVSWATNLPSWVQVLMATKLYDASNEGITKEINTAEIDSGKNSNLALSEC